MSEKSKKILITGNEAITEGAIAAGCLFYFGYPITPQNEIPAFMAKKLPMIGGCFIQAESEIAAINMVYGAAAAGVRSMTTSSSPGISLKQEGISFLAGAELPAVIVNICRGGPGLGNIAGSQGDYFQATKGGGHGDYRTIVLGPSSIQELYDLTFLAFDLADIYRTPVLILADGVLGQMMEPLAFENGQKPKMNLPEKTWALTGAKNRPPNIIKSLYMGEGELEEKNWLLYQKYQKIQNNEIRYKEYHAQDAELLLVAYGLSARICKGVVNKARKQGIALGLFQPVTLYPFPSSALAFRAGKIGKVLTIEMNMGQMVEDVKLATGSSSENFFYGRPGGGIPSDEEIFQSCRKLL